MNFIKKLLKILLALVLLAGIGGALWYFYGDQVIAEVDNIQEALENDKKQAILDEQNKDFLAVLNLARNHINKANLVECDIYTEYSYNNDVVWESTTARDKSTSLYRRTTGGSDYSAIEIVGQQLILPSRLCVQECWVKYDTDGEEPWTLEILQQDDNGQHYHSAEWRQWYYTNNTLYPEQFLFRRGELPLLLVDQMQVLDYTEVGMEECNGEQAMHYIVTHQTMMNNPAEFDKTYYYFDEATQTWTAYAPKEYFETAIPQTVKDGYPELYHAFMELVDKRFYQDNQTHMWITEDGRLLKIELDDTLEAYEYAILSNYEDMWMTVDIYDEETQQVITVPTAFAQLSPVTRVIYFSYNDDVDPIVLPTEYIDLTTQ